MDNTHYTDPALAQFYDASCNLDRGDFPYCTALAAEAASVLDLGCGTGEWLASLTGGQARVGADPAATMLDIARARPGGHQVQWVEGDARTLRLGQRFDLIVLTGHAYQCFLSDADQQAALATIAAHLSPDGRFIFDSRNPGFPAPKERRRDEGRRWIEHPEFGRVEAWNESVYDTAAGILTYENGYRLPASGKEHSAKAQIRYTPQPDLARMIGKAGLAVESWLGDWDGSAFHPEAREIIPLGRLA